MANPAVSRTGRRLKSNKFCRRSRSEGEKGGRSGAGTTRGHGMSPSRPGKGNAMKGKSIRLTEIIVRREVLYTAFKADNPEIEGMRLSEIITSDPNTVKFVFRGAD